MGSLFIEVFDVCIPVLDEIVAVHPEYLLIDIEAAHQQVARTRSLQHAEELANPRNIWPLGADVENCGARK